MRYQTHLVTSEIFSRDRTLSASDCACCGHLGGAKERGRRVEGSTYEKHLRDWQPSFRSVRVGETEFSVLLVVTLIVRVCPSLKVALEIVVQPRVATLSTVGFP